MSVDRGHVIVTGGAGYIGSHACKALSAAGFVPVAFDNLSTGWAQAVKYGPLEIGDLMDRARLDAVFAKYRPVAVMHFAALSLVGESMQFPGRYWRENVTGALNLIEAALRTDCKDFIFSSTCATFGDHDGVTLTEETEQRPINAYGGSKKAIEEMLRDFAESDGLGHVIFRYFNVAGADPECEIGELHSPETHLIPIVIEATQGKRESVAVFGDDYPTPDGTCIRDYVHVVDLVNAHIAGLEWRLAGKENRAFNLGTGHGYSVREVIDTVKRVTNAPLTVQQAPRRAGDASYLVSGSQRAIEELTWRPLRSSLETIVEDAYQWHQSGISDQWLAEGRDPSGRT
jgi:UDP-glucose 4-epimerase